MIPTREINLQPPPKGVCVGLGVGRGDMKEENEKHPRFECSVASKQHPFNFQSSLLESEGDSHLDKVARTKTKSVHSSLVG